MYPFACRTCTRLPNPPFLPADITVPSAIEETGVPDGAA
jgi:hypothetical protein